VSKTLKIERDWAQFQYCVDQVLKHQKGLGIGYMRERLAVDETNLKFNCNDKNHRIIGGYVPTVLD
jgi:hypothetical protein